MAGVRVSGREEKTISQLISREKVPRGKAPLPRHRARAPPRYQPAQRRPVTRMAPPCMEQRARLFPPRERETKNSYSQDKVAPVHARSIQVEIPDTLRDKKQEK